MNRSDDRNDSVTDAKCAVQQKRAPRPLPLFLELLREIATTEPELAAKALQGLSQYERAERRDLGAVRKIVATVGGASLRDCGGSGPPAVLVPSLINPPDVLDLDADVSLAGAIAKMGRRALLLDWGPASKRSSLDLAQHVERLLIPLLDALGEPAALVGYCLGGTMAISAANVVRVDGVVTLAAPWHFSAYPEQTRSALLNLWKAAKGAAGGLQALPMEVLQGAFWSLDPKRTVAKFAGFAELDPESAEAARFVTLEDWANEGEPLPYPAARELMEDLFGSDQSGSGRWVVGRSTVTDALDCPLLNITAAADRIAPAATAAAGEKLEVQSGHVGMIVGSARAKLHDTLAGFLA